MILKKQYKKARKISCCVVLHAVKIQKLWGEVPSNEFKASYKHKGSVSNPLHEIIDTFFAKTSPNCSFSMTEYERFGLVFTKTRVYKFGHRTFWGISGFGSVPLTNGSGSCYFRHWPSKCQQKNNFLTQFFLLITFWSYIYIIFQR